MALKIRKDLEGRSVWLAWIGTQPRWGSRKVARRFRDLWAAADALKALPPEDRHGAAVVPAD
jgi:hypothetical protein